MDSNLARGAERTEQQFRALVTGAGLKLTGVVPTARTFGMLEGDNVIEAVCV